MPAEEDIDDDISDWEKNKTITVIEKGFDSLFDVAYDRKIMECFK